MIAYPALSPDQSRQQFPRKLYDLLQNSNPAIVSWLVDGMSFYVQDEAQFCSTVLPVYLAQLEGHHTAPRSEVRSEVSSLAGRPAPKKSRAELLATDSQDALFM